MEMIGKSPGIHGAVWVTVRIVPRWLYFSSNANQSCIHTFDMEDKTIACMHRMPFFCPWKGYFKWHKQRFFSFANAYAPLDFEPAVLWRACLSYFNMFTDQGLTICLYIQGKTNEPMPLFVKVKSVKFSVKDVQNAMRDHYEGTALDITKDFGAGPYHTPYRLSPLTLG